MTAPALTWHSHGAPGEQMPRLLAGVEPTGGAIALDEHLEQWGVLDLRRVGGDLVDELEASGLVGHGGAWFPVSFMPEFIQRFSRFTLVYWSMEGFSQVLWARATLMEIFPTLGYLTLITGLVMGVSVWRFNKGRIFE